MSRRITTGGLRGERRSSSQPNVSKALKRDFDSVSPSSPENSLTLSSMRQLLKETMAPVTADLEGLKVSAKATSDQLKEITTLTKKVSCLEKENSDLKAKLKESDIKCKELEDRVISMESYSRRNNLKFLNVVDQSTGENCERTILDLCKNLDICLEDSQIERAHRLGGKQNAKAPILVKFLSYKVRQCVFREKARFRQQGVLVVEDYPKEILKSRKMFTPTLNAVYHSVSHKACLQGDKLLLDGRLYTVKDLRQVA